MVRNEAKEVWSISRKLCVMFFCEVFEKEQGLCEVILNIESLFCIVILKIDI